MAGRADLFAAPYAAAVLAGLAAASCCAAGPGLPAEIVRLARVKQQAARQLSRVPDFVCLETIDRFYRPAASRPAVRVDTLRLEVAYVGDRELYSWPGGEPFADRDIDEFSGSGLIGTGHFAGISRALFIDDKASIRFSGTDRVHGRKAIRYEYRVPYLSSGFVVRSGKDWARVAWRGRFWADAESLDLLRVESDAEELPPHFPSSAVHSLVDYGRARIGAADALVPVSAELVAASFDGQLNRNRVRFTGCRQYGSSSSLHFEDLPAASAAALPAAKIWLPAGLTVEIRLRRGLNFDTDAAGDPVTASVEAAVTKAGQVILRKGAELRGRIRSLHQVLHPVPAVLIGIEFTDADYEDTRAFFRAVLDDVGPQTGLQLQRPQMQPGVCTFRALGTGVRLRAGLPMTLRTVATR